MLLKIYKELFEKFGPQGWWPTTKEGKTCPEYTGGPENDRQRLEVAVGAILTQSTAWKNVEKAIINLNRENLVSIEKLKQVQQMELEKIIKPSGFYKQKAERLKIFAGFVSSGFGSVGEFCKNITREELLKVKGIGHETADSILLYACGKPYFVVDAYTRRIFSRLGLIEKEDYELVREFFETALPKKVGLYKEYHALIVKLAKEHCRKKPVCESCPLLRQCKKY